MELQRKFAAAAVVADEALGPREVQVVASTAAPDRAGDVMVPKGCDWKNYSMNPIVLADHDPTKPIGTAKLSVSETKVEALITFAPAGISAKADEYCGLAKAGVLNAVSIGFKPVEYEPLKSGGYRFDKWELMELSFVAVPCNQEALVVERSAPRPEEARSAVSKDDGAWKVGASRNLPVGGDEAWDGPAAEASIFEHAKFDTDHPDTTFARKGFLAYDAAKAGEKGSYKLPFAKVVGGRLTAMPSGIRAAASRLPQADISDEAREKARAVIDHYEAKMKDGKALVLSLSKDDLDCLTIEEKIALARKAAESVGLAVIEAGPSAGSGLKAGAALSAENREHRDAALKCFKAIGEAHAAIGVIHDKVAKLHDDLHERLQAAEDHMEKATEHLKALGAKKPSRDDDADRGGSSDDVDPDDPDEDRELSAAARRKRISEALALGS